MRVRRARERRAEEGERLLCNFVEIGEQASGGGQSGAVELAEAVERRDREALLQPPLGRYAVEAGLALLDGEAVELRKGFAGDDLGSR